MNKPEPQVFAASPDAASPQAERARGGRIGVLLVNLGTPDATDAASVRRYLREFLNDRRVIEETGIVWKLVLNGIILPFRPRRKGRDYASIWNTERDESPLKTITRSQAEKLAVSLAALDARISVDWAMRYGNPAMALAIEAMAQRGCDRILLVPLYPQYAAATTATVCDAAFLKLMTMRAQPTLRVAPPYYDDPVYIEAVASSIETELARRSFQPDVILASFHGMPEEYVQKGDPYYDQCVTTAGLLRQRLGLDESRFMLTFQSRFGRAEWLKPYTDMTVKSLAQSGIKNLAVVTPGFSADCLETLEEIAVENAHIFKTNGGTNFVALPCLNDSEAGMTVIETLVRRELAGWVESSRDPPD
jgi:ferrochelatase